MSNTKDERDVYYIPPNFLTSGRLFGGMIRMRNAIEGCVLVVLTGFPIINLPFSLSIRIIILCLITLPLGVFGVIGIDGDSLTEFSINWVRWLKKRRVLYRSDVPVQVSPSKTVRNIRHTDTTHQPPEQLGIKIKRPNNYRRRRKPQPKRSKRQSSQASSPSAKKVSLHKNRKGGMAEDLVPIKDIRNGIIHMKDGRYIKILEVEPINFLLRSVREQKNIVASFASWLKISPVKVQIKVLTKKADISKHLNAIERDMENEHDPKCRELQQDYYNLIKTIGSREAITRRFLIIFEYEPTFNNRKTDYNEVVSTLETAARTARQYFLHCDNVVVSHDDENAFLLELLYTIFNRETSESIPVEKRIQQAQIYQATHAPETELTIPTVIAPQSIDLQHGSYTVMDGLYHAYLMVPSDGFNPRVVAGWTSLLVNAGEGIDVDFYFQREPKERIQAKLGQQIRINRSRIKDTSDTNTDFDDIESAIRSGYYLKQGLSNYEDFYYMNILVTITADTLENLEWRVAEVKRLMISQDMDLRVCRFRQEDAMRASMPFCNLDRKLFERGKRNVLTSAAASCYPFTSYEMSDENGVLLGVNKHNNSLVIVDIFNSRVYKNANLAIIGTSGAGKTFTMQLLALRMRRKGTQVFILAPLKGHEFLRACKNVGGEFISISPASKQCINIMEIRRVDQTANAIIDGVINENSILARKIQQLHIFFGLLIPDMTHEERQLLDETLIRTYALKGITHDNDSLIDPTDPEKYREMPILEDVYNLLIESQETRRMGNILNRLVHGSAKTFNQQTNVDLSNPYTVLDISELTGDLLTVGMFVALDFVWDIYRRGTSWTKVLTPGIVTEVDQDVAYPVTVDGENYYQQIFTVTSETWVCDYIINVAFSDPSAVPPGTKIVDMNNREITQVKTEGTGNGYSGKFKVLYPADSIDGETGSVQLSIKTNVYKYGVYYAVCAEKDQYGNLQNYMVDTDPTIPLNMTAYSSYTSDPDDDPAETSLKIIKLEEGTEIPLRGAIFEVVDPKGATVGTFATNSRGEIVIPLSLAGNYTVYERTAPSGYLLSEEPAKNVQVVYGEQATLTFENAPYGSLEVRKYSDTGMALSGAVIQIQHIESGATYTEETGSAGVAIFNEIQPGAYRITEIESPDGYLKDETVYTQTVVAGDLVSVSIVNEEKPGLRILKYDSKTQEALPDITFEVYKDAELLGQYQTDQFGEILLTDLEPGTYMVKEIATDGSHIVNSTPQQIELEGGDGILQLIFFNDQKPGIHLVKLDSTDLSPLPNATFRIEKVGGTFSKEYVTDENGEIDLTNLEPGAYRVTELFAPDGYLIDDATRVIQINGNENAEFVFTNTKRPSFRLVKLDSFTGEGLGGATFRIAKIQDGSHYLDRVTDANGEINIEDLEPGVYSVQETKAPEGYVIDPTEYHVELFPGQVSELVVSNDRKPNLEIVKTDAVTGSPVADVTFTVKKVDSSTLTTVKTDAEGKALIENLDPGVYEVWEQSVPDNYLLNDEHQLITLVPNRTGTVRFQNYPKPGLTIVKVDSITGDPIKGAKFHITYASNDTFEGEINDLGTYYTDEAGQIKLDNLRDGWYRVTELEPAAGYSIKDPATQDCYIKAGTQKTLTFENTPLSAIVIKKVDADTGAPLEGAWFRIRFLGGTSGTGGTVIAERQTSSNGTIVLTGMKAGTYVIEEISAPDGYVINDSAQTVYLSGKEQDVITVVFGNDKMGSLLITKKDAVTGAPISDVEFLVTNSDGSVIGNANGKFVTDSAGTIRIDGLEPGSTVIVKETRAKDGYLLDDTPQTIKIKANETMTLEFRNQPLGGLIIHKLDSVTKEPLEGAQFKITFADGSFVDDEGGKLSSNGLYTTDKNGQIIIRDVTGTLVVTEVKAPDGYLIDENTRSQTVVVRPDDTQTLTFYNTPSGGLQIIKSDEDTGARIKGVKFEIRKMNGEIIGTYTTDRNGVISLPEAESGWYQVTELKAADGYQLDDTPAYVCVKDGETATLEITNQRMSSIMIHKIDSETREGIYGVKFILYDAGKNPVGEYTTDQDGYIWIDDELTPGKYYLRELEAADGYILDEQYKTVYVERGKCAQITWENTAVTGQIQVRKYAEAANTITGDQAGAPLKGAVYEMTQARSGKVVGYITTDAHGVAASDPLPLGRYFVTEVSAPAYYQINSEKMEAEIEYPGQIIKLSQYDKPAKLGVTIKKSGNLEVQPGTTMRYDLSGIANTSNVALNNFYWHDRLPTDATNAMSLTTGTYNQRLYYRITFKTNVNDYRVLASNLLTSNNYSVKLSAAALGLVQGEYVTDIRFEFGTVASGFSSVTKPTIQVQVKGTLPDGYQIINRSDVGGQYLNEWQTATSNWVTIVRRFQPVTPLPKTGY